MSAPVTNGGRRHLRVLFFAANPVSFWRYAALVSELSVRGHDVQLAFHRPLQGAEGEFISSLASGSGSVTATVAPARGRFDGWHAVSRLVRMLADLARYTHPRYDRATVLRERKAARVLRNLAGWPGFEPLGRRSALRLARRLATTSDVELSERVIRKAAALEKAIPASRRINRYIAEQSPDVVLVTPVVKSPDQIEFLKSARAIGVPAASCVRSWDNLTNKGLLKVVPDRIFVWNEIQRGEAVEMHGMPADRIVTTGAQSFDEWFERTPSTTRNEFFEKVGLGSDVDSYALYLCSSPDIARAGEVPFVLDWIRALRSSPDQRLQRIGVLVRPYPKSIGGDPWAGVDLSTFGGAVIYPPGGARPLTDEARADFFDSLYHSRVVVGVNTTAMIEAAIVGKSVLTILSPEFAQDSTLHFQYLLAENGGFLHVATSRDEHVEQLSRVLDEDAEGAERRRRFIESFVRPHGLDRPAAPILADGVEELSGLPVTPPERASVLLRVGLGVEALACSTSLVVDAAIAPVKGLHIGKRLGHFRLRLGATARRRGLLPDRSGS